MSFVDLIISEVHQFERHSGVKPYFLILTPEYHDKLKLELIEIQRRTSIQLGIKTGKVSFFYGMTIVEANFIYGGSFKWALAKA